MTAAVPAITSANAASASGARLKMHREGPVLILTLSNPAARNALNPSVYRAAAKAIRATSGFRTVRAIVLCGEGEHFSGGGDLRRLARQRRLPASEQQGHIEALHEWIMAIEEAPQPIIAAVEGAAMGGGFSLCLACDLIVAAEDAKFAMSYVNVGLTPDGGGTDSLVRALPPQAALEMLLDGTPCTAGRLYDWGVVNKIVPHGSAFATALEWAQQLARGPFEVQARIKQLVHSARGRSRREQLDAERESFVASLYSDESGERIKEFLSPRKKRALDEGSLQ
ncbi:oxepin-CoA hydrolase, alternative type [Variovorax sp. PAMC26660]|uniref:oxepin-CoA hydrolase, alternative type n=1 Tax=Variovorax sp. PAMC26660 TaxID=2762322 RepID=UPI00164DAC59|nr:enoyl-CoA hydratase family protein [Variovorax sp. PAMC26660]QNK66262.1 enoyl-CoA hydratase/isomerase family protein [Variovorax sp. PAMC26660]